MGEATRDSSIPQLGGAEGLASTGGMPFQSAFGHFISEINRILSSKATQKGYNDAGPDADNRLYLFVRDFVSGTEHDHALGEIIYKVVRFVKKRDPEDLLKIAAWAYLVYRYRSKNG